MRPAVAARPTARTATYAAGAHPVDPTRMVTLTLHVLWRFTLLGSFAERGSVALKPNLVQHLDGHSMLLVQLPQCLCQRTEPGAEAGAWVPVALG